MHDILRCTDYLNSPGPLQWQMVANARPPRHVLLQSSARDRLHLPLTSAGRTDCKPSHWQVILAFPQ